MYKLSCTQEENSPSRATDGCIERTTSDLVQKKLSVRSIFTRLEIKPQNQGLWATINFAFVINGIMVIMMGVLLPYIQAEHSLSYTQSGIVFSAHQLGTFIAVLATGVLPYLIGRKRSTLLMCGGAVVGLLMIIAVHNLFLLILAFALTGICRGTLNNTCNVTTAEVSGNRTSAMNILHSGWAFGALISPVIVLAWAQAAGASAWRLASVTVAVFIGIVWVLFARSTLPEPPPKEKRKLSMSFLRESSFWAPTILLFLYVAVETSIIGWFVFYFIDAGTLPRGLAGIVLTIHWSMMTIGRICIAVAANRIRNKNIALLVMAIATTICFAGMILSGSVVLSILFLLGIGLSMAGMYPTTVATMKGATSPVSLGFTVAISGLGGIFLPSIIGAVADARGLATGISLLLVGAIIMVIVVVWHCMINRRDKSHV